MKWLWICDAAYRLLILFVHICRWKTVGLSTVLSFLYLVLWKLFSPYTCLWRLMLFTLLTAPQFHCVVSLLTGQPGAWPPHAPSPKRNLCPSHCVYGCWLKMPSLGNVKAQDQPHIQCGASVTPMWPSGWQWHNSVPRQCHSAHHRGVRDDLI